MDSFFINGISSETVGLYADTPPMPNKAVQRVTHWQTSQDEDSATPDDTFNNVNYQLVAYVFKPVDYHHSMNIYKFIEHAETLQISRLDGLYFKIRQADVVSELQLDGNRVRYVFNFVLAPFKYFVENPVIDVNNNSYIVNEGQRYSKPTFYLTVQNPGEVKLIVNGSEFKIVDCSEGEQITVYTDRYIATSNNGIINHRTFGFFPFLAEGNNRIQLVNCTAKVQVNARCY